MFRTLFHRFRFFNLSIAILFFYNLRSAPPKTLLDWELVFQDEFEGEELDKKKWNPTYNWGNSYNHRAWCVAENV
ncbi:MAG: hypothetical protein PVI26_14850 [Chitinispirillia bacterium]